MGRFPDFIIVGAMKCGTTVLWHNMNRHPGITMGKNWQDPKKASTEIRFFDNGGPYHNWKKGVEWYQGCFRGNYGGEKCAKYIESMAAMRRMSEMIPKVKVIMNIRNPVDRAYSEWFMQRDTAPKKHTKGFEHAMKKDKGYRNRGKYYRRLEENVLPFFPRDQVYLVVQEWMIRDTNKELNKLYKWLGKPEIKLDVSKVRFEDRDKTIKHYKKWRSKYRPMRPPIRRELLEYYKEHNDRLFEWLGYEIKEWRK